MVIGLELFKPFASLRQYNHPHIEMNACFYASFMTRVLLIRHGETPWNINKVFRGQADIPLTDYGIAQARALAKTYSAWPIAAVYSSPLQRALKTAEFVAEPHKLEITVHDGLNKLNDTAHLESGMKDHEIKSEDF